MPFGPSTPLGPVQLLIVTPSSIRIAQIVVVQIVIIVVHHIVGGSYSVVFALIEGPIPMNPTTHIGVFQHGNVQTTVIASLRM